MSVDAEHGFLDSDGNPFTVRLTNFEGPFDLLLQLIAKRKLDVTEVALSEVTDEFVANTRAGAKVWDLDTTSQFLLVAATLLDLKAARLLPSGEVEDEADLEILAARDLLFARLLQYRAYKQVSKWIGERMLAESMVYARPGGLEKSFGQLLPQVVFPGGLERFVKIAVKVFTPTQDTAMPLEQLHLVQVNVQEEGKIVVAMLRKSRAMTFRTLCQGIDRLHTVARFLALLELFKLQQVRFDQLSPLGELTITWVGRETDMLTLSPEFDEEVVEHE
uniref:segregation and condensation protein A n=1 Tax=Vaginimicrobium propionicum TaxID=1871034 RepID=UPI0009710620|nr:segregation/condensation protein A [Vaginimicrobium propionicum]